MVSGKGSWKADGVFLSVMGGVGNGSGQKEMEGCLWESDLCMAGGGWEPGKDADADAVVVVEWRGQNLRNRINKAAATNSAETTTRNTRMAVCIATSI